ncbi:BTAD domain-containing putative transcriptional regulator [Kitasatospora sp. NPDC056446]|uniref:AfsR/SARP family transcriptional regulator n=1 Tax=Kitasatospora sp. NPDC056446 TaxID=3345819 RepID=UPI0036AE3AA4
MRIGVLGPLRVVKGDAQGDVPGVVERDVQGQDGQDGRAVEVGGARLRLLLARLALDPGRVVTRERLVDDLWGDTPPEEPVGAVQSLVSRLRRALGPDRAAIGSHPAGYLLDLPRAAVDAWDFEQRVAAGRRALAAGEPAEALTLLGGALDLWRGAPFADAGGAAFAAAPAARLTELRLSAVEDRADAALALGTAGPLSGAVAELTGLCAADPLRERAAARLVRALHADGQPAAALRAFERTRRALAEELGADPSAELREAHLRVLSGGPPPTRGPAPAPSGRPAGRAAPPASLPASLTALVGRDDALAAVGERLGRARLVTLTGPGGVGKTRLALAVAAAAPAGTDIRLAELAGAATPEDVVRAVLTALCRPEDAAPPAGGLPTGDGGREPVERVLRALEGREVLLVLDNCEHLVDAAAGLAHRLLAAAPGLTVLATSREPLGLTGEVLWPVPPLAVPAAGATAEEALAHPAVALFVERAAAAAPGFALDRDTVGPVVRICRELDGLPLALELAAARLRSLGPGQLAARLHDRLRLLDRGPRTAPGRHRTLRAVIDWSWDLLDEAERVLLRRLSVFAGGALLSDLHPVCAAHWPVAPDGDGGNGAAAGPDLTAVEDLLASLVEKSLVVAAGRETGAVRYRLLETIREYAAGRLAAAGEADRAGAAHLSHYLGLAEAAEPRLRTDAQVRLLARLDAEQGNLDAALRRAVAAGPPEHAVRLAAARAWPWLMRGRGQEAGEWASAVLVAHGPIPPSGSQQAPDEASEQAHALCVILAQLTAPLSGAGEAANTGEDAAAGQAAGAGQAARAVPPEAMGRALVTAQRADHPVALGAALLMALGGPPEALGATAERFCEHPDAWVRAAARLALGRVELGAGRIGPAEHALRTAVDGFRALGDRWGLAMALVTLATLLSVTGAADEALAVLAQADECGAGTGGSGGGGNDAPLPLLLSGRLRARNGEPAAARSDLERALAAAERARDPHLRAAARYALAELLRRTGDLAAALRDQQETVRQLERLPADGATAATRLHLLALLHTGLGRVEQRLGAPDRAGRLHRRALELAEGSGDRPVRADVLEGYAEYCLAQGDPARGAAALGAAYGLRGAHDAGDPELRAVLDGCAAALGEDGFRSAWERGLALPRPESLALEAG